MASEGSKRKDRGSADVGTWWVAGHEEHGLACGMGQEGGPMLRLYEELDKELIEDIKELNEDDLDKGWRAIRVSVEIMD